MANPARVILAEEAAMLTLIVYGDISGSGGVRKLPQPRRIVAVLFLFGVLGWISEFGYQAGRVASAVGGALFLTALLLPASGYAANLTGLIGTLTSHLTGSGASGTQSQTAGGDPSQLQRVFPGYTAPQSPFGPQSPQAGT